MTGTATSNAHTAMYLAERDESRRPTRSVTSGFPTELAPVEAVRPVPVPQLRDRRTGRDTHSETESGKSSRAVRERAQSDPGRETKEAMAGCDGAPFHIDDRVAVQRGLTRHLDVEDLRTHLERPDVRRPDRAVGADEPGEPRAVLCRVECLRDSARVLRGGSGRGVGESGERNDRSRND